MFTVVTSQASNRRFGWWLAILSRIDEVQEQGQQKRQVPLGHSILFGPSLRCALHCGAKVGRFQIVKGMLHRFAPLCDHQTGTPLPSHQTLAEGKLVDEGQTKESQLITKPWQITAMWHMNLLYSCIIWVKNCGRHKQKDSLADTPAPAAAVS